MSSSNAYSAKRLAVCLATTAAVLSPSLMVQSFQPLVNFPQRRTHNTLALRASSLPDQGDDQSFFPTPSDTSEQQPLEASTTAVTEPVSAKPAKKAAAKKASSDNEGLFAPAVLLTKEIIGITELNKLRGKIIKMHSAVIGDFTETAQSEFGIQVLRVLFTLADKNGDGSIDEEELTAALQSLGFDFLKEKEIAKIFNKADDDKNGTLDFEEFSKVASPTLKQNLIKLAKKNGHELGFLAK